MAGSDTAGAAPAGVPPAGADEGCPEAPIIQSNKERTL